MRLTKNRQLILDIFKKHNEPLSAEMIADKINDVLINLSTIYRTLDLFFSKGIIGRSNIGHTAYYYINDDTHHHYMICLGCNRKFELDCHLDKIAYEEADEHGFEITQHDLTVYGYCSECKKKSHN